MAEIVDSDAATVTAAEGVEGPALPIERIEVSVLALPFRRRHLSGVQAAGKRLYVLTKIRAGDLVGYGEATVLKEWGGDHGRYFGEAPLTTAMMITEYLGPSILGMNATAIPAVLSQMDSIVKGYPYAKAAIDIALHDILGRLLGCPISTLLGGQVRDRIRVAHSMGVMETDALLDEVGIAVEEGVKTIKLKVGFDPDRDVEVVRLVRALVGDSIEITVDANRKWRDVNVAVRTIKRMEPYNVKFVEQPVEGLLRMSRVAAAVDTDIMADESAWSAVDVLEIAQSGAGDLVSIYTTKPGGLRRAVKAGAVAEAAGLRCNVNGSAETGIGNAANLHLASAIDVATEASVLPVSGPAADMPTAVVGRFFNDDVIESAFTYVDGNLVVPTGPGLGIDVDEEKVRHHEDSRFVICA